MILGQGTAYYGYCFEEIDQAVQRLTKRVVVFNEKHYFKAPPQSIIFNLENVPGQVNPALWKGHEIWDASLRNISRYPKDVPVTHVPMGYEPSMKRFERKPLEERDIDVVFSGCMNERRVHVISELRKLGWRVELPPTYGSERDELIARSRIALDMRYYEDGIFPTLRSLHLIANGMPVVAETSPEMYPWVLEHVPYHQLVSRIDHLLHHERQLDQLAEESNRILQKYPLTLPPETSS